MFLFPFVHSDSSQRKPLSLQEDVSASVVVNKANRISAKERITMLLRTAIDNQAVTCQILSRGTTTSSHSDQPLILEDH